MSECGSTILTIVLPVFKRIVSLIQIIGPILAIISITFYFIKLMINPEEKKIKKKIMNSCIALVFLFFIPLIVMIVMNIVSTRVDYLSCWNELSSDKKLPLTDSFMDDPDLNLDYDKGFLVDSNVYENGISRDSNSSNTINNNSSLREAYVASLMKISNQVADDVKNGISWKYSNQNVRSTFELAKNSSRVSNCALYIVWGLVDIGAIQPGQGFYKAYKDGKNYIVWRKDTEQTLTPLVDFIDGKGKTAKQMIADGEMIPGDIVLWYNHGHTNAYAGNNQFFEAGRVGSNGNGSMDNYYFKNLGPVSSGYYNSVVWKIIRLK